MGAQVHWNECLLMKLPISSKNWSSNIEVRVSLCSEGPLSGVHARSHSPILPFITPEGSSMDLLSMTNPARSASQIHSHPRAIPSLSSHEELPLEVMVGRLKICIAFRKEMRRTSPVIPVSKEQLKPLPADEPPSPRDVVEPATTPTPPRPMQSTLFSRDTLDPNELPDVWSLHGRLFMKYARSRCQLVATTQFGC